MTNLAGHDIAVLLDAFNAARLHGRPVCFITYTIKGFGLPLAGHKDSAGGRDGILRPADKAPIGRCRCLRGLNFLRVPSAGKRRGCTSSEPQRSN